MPSTIVSPAATTIVTFLTANGFTGYKWARADMDLPAGVVELPTIERSAGGSQVGSVDWTMEFPVALYFALDEASTDQEAAAVAVEAFIGAVDDNPSLSDPTVIEDAVVTSAEPDFDADSQRPMVVYTCLLRVFKTVPS